MATTQVFNYGTITRSSLGQVNGSPDQAVPERKRVERELWLVQNEVVEHSSLMIEFLEGLCPLFKLCRAARDSCNDSIDLGLDWKATINGSRTFGQYWDLMQWQHTYDGTKATHLVKMLRNLANHREEGHLRTSQVCRMVFLLYPKFFGQLIHWGLDYLTTDNCSYDIVSNLAMIRDFCCPEEETPKCKRRRENGQKMDDVLVAVKNHKLLEDRLDTVMEENAQLQNYLAKMEVHVESLEQRIAEMEAKNKHLEDLEKRRLEILSTFAPKFKQLNK